jgi:CBS domain-containing protein
MSTEINPDVQLEAVANTLRTGGPSPRLTVRAFLGWFGAQRRGYWIVRSIRYSLQRAGLRTTPDFESSWIDGPLTFGLAGDPAKPETTAKSEPIVDFELEPPAADAPESPTVVAAISTRPVEGTSELLVGPADAVGPKSVEEERPTSELKTIAGREVESPTLREPGVTPREIRPGDPSHRISKLKAANQPPASVKPDSSLSEAATIMLTNDYSQVPVMINEREVKGVVSWQSVGSRLALGFGATAAREVMDRAVEIRADASIFDSIPTLVESGYVLVRGPDGKVTGIVTSSDLSLQFRALAEPFLLLSEIENRIRNIISERFDLADLETVRDPDDKDRRIESVDDLTMGEYIRLLEEPARWAGADLKVDRNTFIQSLDNIRRIRNDVMHFDTDSIPDEDLESLRDFARFLRRLEALGVS